MKDFTRASIYRLISDLIKADEVISTGELDRIDAFCKTFGIVGADKKASIDISLAQASEELSRIRITERAKVFSMLEQCTLEDGVCCRNEALLLNAIKIVANGKGRIHSIKLDNRPLLSTQIVFVDASSSPQKNELDTNFEELYRIAELSGFELIYIPKVAASFKEALSQEGRPGDNLERLLSIINPKLDENTLRGRVRHIQDMDSRYFLMEVMNGKLNMNILCQHPLWLVRLPNSVMSGHNDANYLCYDVDMDDIKSQLSSFMTELNRRQPPYSVVVNNHTEKKKDFSYRGFYKSLLDVMASDAEDSWKMVLSLRDNNGIYSGDNEGVISISRGKQKYPFDISGREAAFYAFLLCASASQENGVDFEYSPASANIILKQYECVYRRFSVRESVPDITQSSSFRPIKSKVIHSLEKTGIGSELFLFKPTQKKRNFYYIPFFPKYIYVNENGKKARLEDSQLFNDFVRVRQNEEKRYK